MSTTRTINFGWNTISEPYVVKCSKCKKSHKRTISTGYNDLADNDYRIDCRNRLRQEAEELSKTSIVCNGCQKSNIKEPVIVNIVDEKTLCEIDSILQLDRDLRDRRKDIRLKFNEHNGRIFFYKNEFYAQCGCSIADYVNDFIIQGCRVNKRTPWETTNDYVNAPFNQIRYCDDTLQNRKQLAANE